MSVEYASFEYGHTGQFESVSNYQYVQLAKHKKKGAKKILLVLDYMPSEDLKSGRLLSGATGTLLKSLVNIALHYYKADKHLDQYDWLAITFNAFKTQNKSKEFIAGAKEEFTDRINFAITKYKPDTVITFGPQPYRALNEQKIIKFEGKMQHLYGVPVETTVQSENREHTFQHVPTLSLNTLVNTDRGGTEMYLAGYVARNLANALSARNMYQIEQPKYKPIYIDTMAKFRKMMSIVKKAKVVAVDTETTSLNRKANRILSIQFAVNKKQAFFVPLYHKETPFLAKELKVIRSELAEYFEQDNQNDYQIYANAVFDLTVIRNSLGVRYFKADVWDLFAGEFAIDENLKFLSSVTGFYYYSLANLSVQYGTEIYYDIEFGKSKRKTIEHAPLDDKLIEYGCLDVVVPFAIHEKQKQRGKDIGHKKYQSLVRHQISDMLHTFSVLEYNGSRTDIDYLFHLNSVNSPIRKEMRSIIDELKQTKGVKKANAILNKNNGVPNVGWGGKTVVDNFDISKKEHKQLLFFDVLKLKPVKLGKSGEPKIDKEFQKKYEDTEEVKLFNRLSGAKKLYSAYVKAFLKQWGSDDDMRSDSRIRPHFQFLPVVTGRTSATKPSLHQIPSRSELGKHIKRLFITDEGRLSIKVDFAAHEVRCLHLDSYVSTEIGMVRLGDLLSFYDKPKIHSYNHETNEIELKEVGTQSIHPPEEDMYEIEYEGGTITVTGNHQIWSVTRNEYVRADLVTADQELIIKIGEAEYQTVAVKSIKAMPRPDLVADIGIEDNHNLFVCDDPDDAPVLVHNCWSIITFDKNVADVFRTGYDLRTRFRLFPTEVLTKRVDLEGDVHKINAAYFFGVDINDVTKVIRDSVKGVIFGLIYQQGMEGLAKNTGQTLSAITKLVKQFKQRFPKGVGWFDEIKKFARKNLFVESPIGRRRHLWGYIVPKDVRNAEPCIASMERRAVNSPVQGLGSDFMMTGSREIERLKWEHYLKAGHLPDFELGNSVHDSLEISCAYEDFWLAIDMIEKGLTTRVAERVRERHGFEFTIPLEVDFEIGANGRDVEAWNYDYDQLSSILKTTLLFQKKELKHDIDVKAIYKSIMVEQYDTMPEWMKKQVWAKGKLRKGNDPRTKEDLSVIKQNKREQAA